MSTKARILEVAAALVAESPDGDVSTRAVCEAAGVGAPALYRHFGDKEGLLSAVVDHGWDKYLATKRHRDPGTDPVQDLRDGWDTHTEFALLNPNLYRLMNSPAMRTPPAAALESHQILTARPPTGRRTGQVAPRPGTRRPDDHVRERRRRPDAGLASGDLHRRDGVAAGTGRGARGGLHAGRDGFPYDIGPDGLGPTRHRSPTPKSPVSPPRPPASAPSSASPRPRPSPRPKRLS